ncbi:hypothetical protein ABIB40_002267 [Pedobacter sp. UYP30]|uniref:DUF2059 domain-containing protein n=1 Tax=Pedobacter sp. UYP30 TaxID=1756400 RepID=UPI00339A605C
MKKNYFVILLFLSLFSINGYAQTKQESIRTLFSVMKQDSLMDKIVNSIMPSLIAQMSSQYAAKNPASKAKMMEATKVGMEVSKTMLKKMVADGGMVAIYDKHFSQDEINDFITFYKSPSGQKLLEEMPSITKDNVIMMQKYIPEMQKEIKMKMDEILSKKTPPAVKD